MLLVLALGAGAERAEAGPDGPASELFALVNAERANAGLPPVQWRDDVASIAADWSAQMASSGALAHNDYYFSGEARDRLGSSWRSENVAAGMSIAEAHAALMNSPSHRANILDSRSVHGGFGVAVDASGRMWVTEDFMLPRAGSAPAPQPAPELAPAPEPEPVEPADAPQPAPATDPEPVPASEPAPPPTVAPDVPATPTTVAPDAIVVEQVAAPAAVVGEPTAPTSGPSSTTSPRAIQAVAAALAATALAGHLRVRSMPRATA